MRFPPLDSKMTQHGQSKVLINHHFYVTNDAGYLVALRKVKKLAYFQSQLFKGQFENFPLLCNEWLVETAVLSMSTNIQAFSGCL